MITAQGDHQHPLRQQGEGNVYLLVYYMKLKGKHCCNGVVDHLGHYKANGDGQWEKILINEMGFAHTMGQ